MEEMTSASDQPLDKSNLELDMSIILVCWNNKEYLEPCLNSLYEEKLRYSFDVVVVDNGSTDGSQEMLLDRFPEVKIIQNDHNVGLSRASNQGIEATYGRTVLLLNNDTLVNKSSLESMVEFLDNTPQAGAVGGKLLNPDGSFQSGYANFSTLTEEFLIITGLGNLIWEGYPSHIDDGRPRVVDWLSSACLLLRRSALDKVGLLDEEYFIYGDEADLQFRLKQAGWQVYYLPYVTTIHYGGRSMNRWRRRKMVYRGKLLFYKKNYGSFRTGLLRVMMLGFSAIKMAIWGISSVYSKLRTRALLEINSNIEVIRLCWKLE